MSKTKTVTFDLHLPFFLPWFILWLFTWGFADLTWWRGLLAVFLWPFYLGVAL